MSFEQNDMNSIHRNNYEEFFILYMDNELDVQGSKMVEAFLAANPDLKVEFEGLMSTKLPAEEYRFDKKELMAENMKLSSVDERLLLYIDGELTANERTLVELELLSDNTYQLQHRLLLQTKLDSSDIIVYPDKKELYHPTANPIVSRQWMKIAAAVLIIALSGVFYIKDASFNTVPDKPVKVAVGTPPGQKNEPVKIEPANSVNNFSKILTEDQFTASEKKNTEKRIEPAFEKKRKEKNVEQEEVVANIPKVQEEEPIERPKVKSIQQDDTEGPETAFNNVGVTSALPVRINNSSSGDNEKLLASNDNERKGSIKGFLRKATRMIEKRTGIDPTNENGELLIGAVAINLR
jgi:hypothetical protein